MKNSPLTTFLLVLTLISALASVYLCWAYISNVVQLRRLQAQVQMANNNRAAIGNLANDALAYSKKNPSILPILESAGLKPGTGPAAANPGVR